MTIISNDSKIVMFVFFMINVIVQGQLASYCLYTVYSYK